VPPPQNRLFRVTELSVETVSLTKVLALIPDTAANSISASRREPESPRKGVRITLDRGPRTALPSDLSAKPCPAMVWPKSRRVGRLVNESTALKS
jgi:hypothetical protein